MVKLGKGHRYSLDINCAKGLIELPPKPGQVAKLGFRNKIGSRTVGKNDRETEAA